jgi:hydroxyethylthiazole kinase-like sugar kinase family protein
MDIMANVLLAAGMSPAMAHSLDEVRNVQHAQSAELRLHHHCGCTHTE